MSEPHIFIDDLRPKWLKPKEVAQALQVCDQTIYDMCRRGELRHRYVGRLLRIHISALQEEPSWDPSRKERLVPVSFGTSSTE